MIILKGYGTAKFLAETSFIDNEYVPSYFKHEFIKGENGSINLLQNPNYPYKTQEEDRIARHQHEQKSRMFVHNYLQKHYPATDYAERFLNENHWDNPLRFHNEETKKCEFLDEDGRHCKKKRIGTTCYTCCYNCIFPKEVCNKCDCDFSN